MTTTLLCVAFRVVAGQLYGQPTIASIRAECATALLTELHMNSHDEFAELLCRQGLSAPCPEPQ